MKNMTHLKQMSKLIALHYPWKSQQNILAHSKITEMETNHLLNKGQKLSFHLISHN